MFLDICFRASDDNKGPNAFCSQAEKVYTHIYMRRKIRLAVLSGGPSSEHEVSLRSGKAVIGCINKGAYDAENVFISRSGEWEKSPADIKKSSDCVFIALRGTYGEDGTVQRILNDCGLAYTGSGALASAIGMNKFLSLRLFQDHGLHIPRTLLIHKTEWGEYHESEYKHIFHHLSFPIVVKPNNQGSSVGVSIVRNKDEFEGALKNAFHFSKEAIAQQFIEGREITCGVLDRGFPESAFPLLPTEIVPKVSHFFDYQAKYDKGGSLEITPPRGLGEHMIQRIRKTALATHKIIGARGFSRTDMILDVKGTIFILEINTIPGLTDESLVPKAALAMGITFPKLLDIIIGAAIYPDTKYWK